LLPLAVCFAAGAAHAHVLESEGISPAPKSQSCEDMAEDPAALEALQGVWEGHRVRLNVPKHDVLSLKGNEYEILIFEPVKADAAADGAGLSEILKRGERGTLIAGAQDTQQVVCGVSTEKYFYDNGTGNGSWIGTYRAWNAPYYWDGDTLVLEEDLIGTLRYSRAEGIPPGSQEDSAGGVGEGEAEGEGESGKDPLMCGSRGDGSVGGCVGDVAVLVALLAGMCWRRSGVSI